MDSEGEMLVGVLDADFGEGRALSEQIPQPEGMRGVGGDVFAVVRHRAAVTAG
ncbi:hypothetical protein ACTWQF_30310 [Streptomyces sp. 8N114]|uniref:hypothetical protein n=1 Tax=Streptomyces sp. 8N114 TaxID=3457419 RepID=UPI003FD34E4D